MQPAALALRALLAHARRAARGPLVAAALMAALAPGISGAQSTAAGTTPSPVVVTASGPVQGTVEDGLAVFRGLPYAAPPVGERRWRAPAPAAAWRTPRAATQDGAACPQRRGQSLENGGDPGVPDEDCLYLNIRTPGVGSGAKRPVMVWIHGGALVFGSGALAIYDGSALAQRDVVVVSINYRLGPLGFFVHPALEAERGGGDANFGLLDQIAALQWVRRNIAAFGGDPQQVTVFGQSAGAQSVLALMASPKAQGLFQRAIAQSPYGVPSHTRAKARESGVAVASAAGLPGARATAASLRRLPTQQLAELDGKGLSLAPGFIVGDAAVPMPLLDAFQQGREAALPLVIGSNSDDASVALAFGVEPDAIVRQMGRARLLVQPLYPGVTDPAQLGREVARDAVFTAYARRIAYLHSRKAPTWRYYFSGPGGDSQPATGAAHGAEVPYVFGSIERCACTPTTPDDRTRALERRMGDRWAAFARTGRPDGAVAWVPDQRLRANVLEIGAADTPRPAFMSTRLNAFITGLNLAARRTPRE